MNDNTRFKDFLQESGIDTKLTDVAGIELLSALEAFKLHGMEHRRTYGCALIPYTPAGTEGYYRLRFLGLPSGEGMKYWGPLGEKTRPYFPPNCPKQWQVTTVPVIIVEGEKKALALQQWYVDKDEPMQVIGLPGIWNFTEEDPISGNKTLHSDLEALPLSTRAIYVAFDNDQVDEHGTGIVGQKAQVSLAGSALAGYLSARGALVAGMLWHIEGYKGKLGPDDFLVQGGNPEEIRANASEADSEFNDSATMLVMRMNERFCWDMEQQAVWDRELGQYHKPSLFPQSFPARLVFPQPNGKAKVVTRAKYWMNHPRRLTIRGRKFMPWTEELMVDGWLNIWQGFPDGVIHEGSEEKIALWERMVSSLCHGEEAKHETWFRKRIGHVWQFPHIKCHTALIIRSTAQGVGKSLFSRTLSRCWGQSGQAISDTTLDSEFSGYLRHNVIISAEEISSGKRKSTKAKLKSMITDSEFVVNEKYLKPVTVDNYSNLIFTSNDQTPIGLDEIEDRRFFTLSVPPDAPILSPDEFSELAGWLQTEQGRARLNGYYLDMDLEGFDPHRRPDQTEYKVRLIADSQPAMVQWAEAVGLGEIKVLDLELPNPYVSTVRPERCVLRVGLMIEEAMNYARAAHGGSYNRRTLTTMLVERGLAMNLGQHAGLSQSQFKLAGRKYVFYAVGKASVEYWSGVHPDDVFQAVKEEIGVVE